MKRGMSTLILIPTCTTHYTLSILLVKQNYPRVPVLQQKRNFKKEEPPLPFVARSIPFPLQTSCIRRTTLKPTSPPPLASFKFAVAPKYIAPSNCW